MTLADTFTTWKSGVLVGLGAPDNAITTDALWAWSQAEGGLSHLNPLNTTYFMAGAVPWNTLSNGLHVWSYLTIGDGINATVVTLLSPDPSVGLPNGYDIIVDHLRRSIPRQQWQDACWQLQKWGTGCRWLDTFYGAAPGVAVGETPEMPTFIRDPSTGAIFWIGESGKRHVDAKEWSLYLAAGANYSAADDTTGALATIPDVGAGGTPEPTEPAEPRTVTLNVPAQSATVTLSAQTITGSLS